MRKPTAILFASLALAGADATAAITGVTGAPSSTNVGLGRATSVRISWTTASSGAGMLTVSSAQGQFRTPAGTLLGTVAQPLSKTMTGPGTASFTEALLVPADIVQRAHKEGFDRLRYERSFTDGAAATGQVALRIVTTSAAAFGVSRLALAFESGEALQVVARGEKLQARAEVSYTGSGSLRGSWEIAGPNPDAGKPSWRVLGEVSQALTAADTATLKSPALPTDTMGPFLVRLRIGEPAVGFELPVIRYSVTEKKN
jgi:hypothetical protein